MKWINNFDLFLFDFDGLLVNTERLHFLAYENMLKKRGYDLGWSFSTYASIAHLSSDGIKIAIYEKFPKLFEMEPSWEVLYKEKKSEYLDILNKTKIELMPGAGKVLNTIKKQGKKSCVVTNSLYNQVEIILKNNPILKNIDHWITREDYNEPKPHPECYLKAIDLYSKKGDKVIGFEDSIRGMLALSKTPATCVLISENPHPEKDKLLQKKVSYFKSFEEIPDLLSFCK